MGPLNMCKLLNSFLGPTCQFRHKFSSCGVLQNFPPIFRSHFLLIFGSHHVLSSRALITCGGPGVAGSILGLRCHRSLQGGHRLRAVAHAIGLPWCRSLRLRLRCKPGGHLACSRNVRSSLEPSAIDRPLPKLSPRDISSILLAGRVRVERQAGCAAGTATTTAFAEQLC